MGAHFLSDVCVSSLLTIGFGALAVWLFYFNRPFFGRIWLFFSGEAAGKKQPVQKES